MVLFGKQLRESDIQKQLDFSVRFIFVLKNYANVLFKNEKYNNVLCLAAVASFVGSTGLRYRNAAGRSASPVRVR